MKRSKCNHLTHRVLIEFCVADSPAYGSPAALFSFERPNRTSQARRLLFRRDLAILGHRELRDPIHHLNCFALSSLLTLSVTF
jgi:hypothetical protein